MAKITKPINKSHILYKCEEVHISLIKKGDTVFHNGDSKTVGENSLKYDNFGGYTLFGDPYLLGRKPVIRFITAEGGKLVAAE